jgi:hypothetical protein
VGAINAYYQSNEFKKQELLRSLSGR